MHTKPSIFHSLGFFLLLVLTSSCGIGSSDFNPSPSMQNESTSISTIAEIVATEGPILSSTPTTDELTVNTAIPIEAATIIPTIPYKEDENYELINWTPEDAMAMIRQMFSQVDQHSNEPWLGDMTNTMFNLAISQAEAVRRFPSDYLKGEWQWQLANNLALSSFNGTGELYGLIISEGLNDKRVSINNMKRWFENRIENVDLEITSLTSPDIADNAYLVNIDFSVSGGACLLLLEDNQNYYYQILQSGFHELSLQTAMVKTDISCRVSDLTGDGIDEIVLERTFRGGNSFTSLQVISLLMMPPNNLGFDLLHQWINDSYNTSWGINKDPATDQAYLYSDHDVGGGSACGVEIFTRFEWNGEWFTPIENKVLDFYKAPYASICIWDNENINNFHELEERILYLEMLDAEWPSSYGELDPEYVYNQRDSLHFYLAIFHALIGNDELAEGYLNQVINESLTTRGEWIEPAEIFLNRYETQNDLYRACVGTKVCLPRFALERIINDMPPQSPYDVLTYLLSVGIPVSGNGQIDLDVDGELETWFTIRHRYQEDMELWLLASYNDGTKSIYIGTVDSLTPQFEHLQSIDDSQIWDFGSTDEFAFGRHDESGEPFITSLRPFIRYSDPELAAANAALERAWVDFILGVEIQQIQAELEDIKQMIGFTPSDRYYYLLGLVCELQENDQSALNAYLELWRNFPESPFAIMVMMRLGLNK